MKLLLVRHVQPLVEGGVCYGASDVACDPQLMQQAAERLLRELPKALTIISSPLQRCEHLAQYLSQLEPSFGLKTDAALAEMDFGHWEMRRWSAIAPQELTAWTDDFAHYRCGGSGESTAQFVQRVAARLARSLQAGRDEMWITHAGVIRALWWLQRQSTFSSWMDTVNLLESEQQQGQPTAALNDLLRPLRAADWPADEVAYCQLMAWEIQPALAVLTKAVG